MPIRERDVRPLPFDFGLPIGAQYYRAPTPRPDQWEADLNQLKEYGMNTIKIWAQWRWSRPSEDEFHFDDLDRLMDLAAERDLAVVINTIFDVAPAWLFRKHPDALMVRQNGQPVGPTTLLHRQIGGAPGPCLHHTFAREERERFLEATVERYRGHPALWFWDLWNEPELSCGIIRGGPPEEQVCYCEHSRSAFLQWLRERYKSLEDLNDKWSRNYSSWEEVETPTGSHVYADWIDWRMFFRDTIAEEMRWRAELTRRVDPDHPVMCHTVPPPVFNIACCGSDDFELATEGDLFGNSSTSKPFPTDYCRSAAEGKPLICSEIHALPGTTLLRPTPLSRPDFEKYILVPLFHGAKGFLFWQYRPEQLGKEAPAWGMIRPDGAPEPWLEYCRDLSGWLQQHSNFLLRAKPDPARIAILIIPENEVFFYAHDHDLGRYWSGILGAHELFTDAGHPVDFLHSGQLLNGSTTQYEFLVAPVPYAYTRAVADALIAYVRDGGNLLMEGFPCAHDPETGLASLINPGMGLDEMLGCREESVLPESRFDPAMAYGSGRAEMAGKPALITSGRIGALEAGSRISGRFAEQHLRVTTGEVLATFANDSAAMVRNRFGKGEACLIGCWVFPAYHEEPSKELRELVTGGLSIPRPMLRSDEVRVSRLSGDGVSWLLLENVHSETVRAKIWLERSPRRIKELPGGEPVSFEHNTLELDVAGNGFRIVEVQ